MEEKCIEIQQQKYLPEDLIYEHILTRLPIKSLQDFKLVSKKWYKTISSDYRFALSHFKSSPFSHPCAPTQFILAKSNNVYYILSYDDHGDMDFDIDANDDDDGCSDVIRSKLKMVKLKVNFDVGKWIWNVIVVGCCNGLVCLGDLYDFVLWNPVTNQLKKFYSDPDDRDLFESSKVYHVIWGFGYVSSVDDYKVVRIVEATLTEDIIVDVFSLRSNKWSRIDAELYQHAFSLKTTRGFEKEERPVDENETIIYPISFYSRYGKLVGDTLYWVVAKQHVRGMNVVAFNLFLEKFDLIPDLSTTNEEDGQVFCTDFFRVVGGCLTKRYVTRYDSWSRDVWIRIVKGLGEEEYMCVERDLSCVGIVHGENMVGFTRTRKLLTLRFGNLHLLDPISQPIRHKLLWKFGFSNFPQIISYAPSLIDPSLVQFRGV